MSRDLFLLTLTIIVTVFFISLATLAEWQKANEKKEKSKHEEDK